MNHLLQRILGKSIPLVITGTLLVSGMVIPGTANNETIEMNHIMSLSPTCIPGNNEAAMQLDKYEALQQRNTADHRTMDGLAGLRAVSGYRAGGRYCHDSAKRREL